MGIGGLLVGLCVGIALSHVQASDPGNPELLAARQQIGQTTALCLLAGGAPLVNAERCLKNAREATTALADLSP